MRQLRGACRFCGARLAHMFVDLGMSPIANHYLSEDEAKGGRDPYSNSKACSELVTSAYRDSFFGPDSRVAAATVRAGNVIGGGDWGADRLIPDIMRAALGEAELHVRNPGAIRPWQHVLNPLSGYLRLVESLWESDDFADGWNFGPEERDARPVHWIIERLEELWATGKAPWKTWL